MRIERSQIRNLERYLSILPPDSSFKVVCPVTEAFLDRAGFGQEPEDGTSLLPEICGRVSKFNAEGKWLVRRDLPKEDRYVGCRSWTRTEWHGQDAVEVDETVYIYRKCYPRDFVPPPSVELAFVWNGGVALIVSPTMHYDYASNESNKHIINLMLELFGECEIVLENLARLSPPLVKRANWLMLPPGEDPWERIEAHVMDAFNGRSPSVVKAVLERQQVILAHRPFTVVRGHAGFSDYIAYVFPEHRAVVLDSIRYGNALYVLGEDWEAVSKLSKAQIIQDDLAENRIVHSKMWVARLAEVLRPKAA